MNDKKNQSGTGKREFPYEGENKGCKQINESNDSRWNQNNDKFLNEEYDPILNSCANEAENKHHCVYEAHDTRQDEALMALMQLSNFPFTVADVDISDSFSSATFALTSAVVGLRPKCFARRS